MRTVTFVIERVVEKQASRSRHQIVDGQLGRSRRGLGVVGFGLCGGSVLVFGGGVSSSLFPVMMMVMVVVLLASTPHLLLEALLLSAGTSAAAAAGGGSVLLPADRLGRPVLTRFGRRLFFRISSNGGE